IVGLRYLISYEFPDSGLAFLYSVLVYVSNFAVLGYVPLMLLLLPVIILVPKKPLVMPLAVAFAAFIFAVLVLDSNIFVQYRYHLSGLTIAIFETSTWVMAGVILLALLMFEALLAVNVWSWLSAAGRRTRGALLASVLVAAWLAAQGIHIWADAVAYTPVTQFTRLLPGYYPIKAKRTLAKLGWLDPEEVERRRSLRRAVGPDGGQLKYPLEPLQCSADKPTLNILLVLIDALRPDSLIATQTPVLHAFAEQGIRFAQHYSGGNSSRMGIFSLFYGLPSTYWQSFYDGQRAPVLMQQLQASGYQIVPYSAVGFGSPSQIDRTVFAGVSELHTVPSNQAVTDGWLEFLQTVDGRQPFFGFLYYDPGTAVSFADGDARDLAARTRAYKDGVRLIDKEVGRVLEGVTALGLNNSTLIIVASDHGYELDDNGLGYIGHGSSFSRAQLRSTLLMQWPGREAQTVDYRTAHHDVAGTVLQGALGCDTAPEQYSSGSDLFDDEPWQWIIAGSYNAHAIVQPDRVVVNYGGLTEVLGEDYRPGRELEIDGTVLQDAMLEMQRFYK
ncbi:MAG: DUF3413 domain-containing protein, partial [Gammaproteobacteria bacterium]